MLWALFVLSIVYRVLMAEHNTLALQLPGQLSFFMIGALIHYHVQWFEAHGKWITLAAVLLWFTYVATGWFVFRPAAVSTLTLSACLLLPVVKGPRAGETSLTASTSCTGPSFRSSSLPACTAAVPWIALALTLLSVAIGAVLSWFLVEKPSLALAHSRRIKTRYPAVTPS